MLDAPATYRILTPAGTFRAALQSGYDTSSVWAEIYARNAFDTYAGRVRFNPAHGIAVVEVSP